MLSISWLSEAIQSTFDNDICACQSVARTNLSHYTPSPLSFHGESVHVPDMNDCHLTIREIDETKYRRADDDDAEMQRQLRAGSRLVLQRYYSPAVPPGFELQAAHIAVARATTGLRRSSRASNLREHTVWHSPLSFFLEWIKLTRPF